MNEYEQLAKALAKVVSLTGDTWEKRAEKVRDTCGLIDGADLEEFLSWFDE